MAVLAGFQLATAPAQPQSQSLLVTSTRGLVAMVQTTVSPFNGTIRPADPGTGYAY